MSVTTLKEMPFSQDEKAAYAIAKKIREYGDRMKKPTFGFLHDFYTLSTEQRDGEEVDVIKFKANSFKNLLNENPPSDIVSKKKDTLLIAFQIGIHKGDPVWRTVDTHQGHIVLKSTHENKIVIANEKWFQEKSADSDVYHIGTGEMRFVGGDDGIGPFVGYNYWNGHNLQTVTIEAEFFEPDFKRVDEKTERDILSAYFNRSYKQDIESEKLYEADGYEFVISRNVWEWALATVHAK